MATEPAPVVSAARRLEVQVEAGLVVLRTPPLSSGAHLMAWALSGPLPSALGALQGGADLGGVLAGLGSVAPQLVALAGALVGIAWADPSTALESVAPVGEVPADAWADYGEAVADELDDGGWSAQEILLAAWLVWQRYGERHRIEGAALERAGFFAAKKGAKTSESSTSGSSTSATPGDISA